MKQRSQKACHGCRIRKVKCTGSLPCAQCDHLNLKCEFATPGVSQRLPPIRGRLLAQARQRTGHGAAQFPVPSVTVGQENTSNAINHFNEQTNSVELPLGHVYSAEFFMNLIPDFERVAFPVNPIISGEEIAISIQSMHMNKTHAALVYAFAAVTVNLSHASWSVNGEISSRIRDLMSRSLAMHRQVDPDDIRKDMPVSVHRVVTCIFLEICMMGFGRYDRSFSLIREAITLIQLLFTDRHGSNDETEPSPPELARQQRLYWEAYVHERFLTIMSNYPSILPVLHTGLPFEDPTIPLHVDVGFSRIIHLFLIIDDDFIAHWRWQSDPTQTAVEMTAAWIEAKQQELDDDEAFVATETLSLQDNVITGVALTELQQVDLYITRTWLRTIVWQLAMSHCLLSSEPPSSSHEAMSLVFPVQRLSSQLRQLVMQLESITSIGVHGFGILQKLFEITNTIADVMALVPAAIAADKQEGVQHQRMADLVFLVRFLFSFERIDQVQRDIINTKLEHLKELIPDFEYEASSELLE